MEQEKMDPHSRTQAEAAVKAEYARAYEGSLAGQISRPKPWAELSIEEKIERTREQVKGISYSLGQLHRLGNEIRRLRADFTDHRHGQDAGVVMLPADRRQDAAFNELQGQCASNDVDPSKAYF